MAEVQFVERAILRVNGVDLDDIINSVTEDGDVPSKFVNTMNKRRRPKGVKQGNSNYNLSINAEQIDDPSVPDWSALRDGRITCKIVVQKNIGAAVTYTGRVSKVTDRTSDGDSSQDITFMAWDRI